MIPVARCVCVAKYVCVQVARYVCVQVDKYVCVKVASTFVFRSLGMCDSGR